MLQIIEIPGYLGTFGILGILRYLGILRISGILGYTEVFWNSGNI